jgi:nucleoside-diphosphate-sugar epimerase
MPWACLVLLRLCTTNFTSTNHSKYVGETSMANVFFTGFTPVNAALITALQSKGYRTIVLSDDEQITKAARFLGAVVVKGHIAHPDSYIESVKGADVVIHSPNIYDLEDSASDAVAVAAITKALAGSKKIFVYTSHTWVLGDANNVLADEKTPVAPISLVAPLARSEQSVLQSAGDNIKAIVVRAANVYGYEGDFVQKYVARTIREDVAHFVGNGNNYFSVIALQDLVQLYLLVIEKGVAGAIYHAASGKALTSKEFAGLVGDIVGVHHALGLSQSELKNNYGALAEAFSLNQQISFIQTKEQLNWAPDHTDLTPYIEKQVPTAVG